MSLFVNSPLPSSTLSARHAVASSRQHRRVVASKRTQTIHTTTRAGLLDGLFGVKDGEKRVNRPKPGTKTVMFCSCCKNKGQEKCPGCKGTGQSKVNGNVMERFKCMVCQGVGAIPCSNCNRGGKGLTPEQAGDR